MREERYPITSDNSSELLVDCRAAAFFTINTNEQKAGKLNSFNQFSDGDVGQEDKALFLFRLSFFTCEGQAKRKQFLKSARYLQPNEMM